MRMLLGVGLSILLLVVYYTSVHYNPATAQTADSQTPAQESICDGQAGAAYGLCTAYCEAMDCDSATPQASSEACSRVLNQFMKITGVEPPCLVPPPPPVAPPPPPVDPL